MYHSFFFLPPPSAATAATASSASFYFCSAIFIHHVSFSWSLTIEKTNTIECDLQWRNEPKDLRAILIVFLLKIGARAKWKINQGTERRKIKNKMLNEMSSTLLCIGHPLHGKRAVFTPIWKFVSPFSLSLLLPHPSRTLIHHFHSWLYVCVRAWTLYKNFHFICHPFFPWRSTILFNIHLFNHVFFFSFAIPMASTTLHSPLSLFLMSFVPSSIFSTTTKNRAKEKLEKFSGISYL